MAFGKGDPDAKVKKKLEKAKRAEEKAAQAKKAADDREKARREAAINKAVAAFDASPAGMARDSFEAGDHVFQYSIDVASQEAIIVAMMGSTTKTRTIDPSDVLNSVCHEGWELVNGDFVFVMQGQQSRDKFASSGQNVAVKGTTMGYYLFRRCEQNRRPETREELVARIARTVR